MTPPRTGMQMDLPTSIIIHPSQDPEEQTQAQIEVPLERELSPDAAHINQNGSYIFDEILKRGVLKRRGKKRGAWRATWKQAHLVLRPGLLSIYNDADEASLRASINLCDVTAVAELHMPRSKRPHVFGIFSPSKNYRFQTSSASDAAAWITAIRNEANGDDLDQAPSDGAYSDNNANFGETTAAESISELSGCESQVSSSPAHLRSSKKRTRPAGSTRSFSSPSHLDPIHDYSNVDATSYSELSDFPPEESIRHKERPSEIQRTPVRMQTPSSVSDTRPETRRNGSYISSVYVFSDSERVIQQGYLECLKSKGGVKQWKRLWGVLRAKNLVFYKTNQEYSAVMIIPMTQVINAAEIDPLSKSRQSCIQVIAEDKTYRFCAPDDEALAAWLGSLKSVLTRNAKGNQSTV